MTTTPELLVILMVDAMRTRTDANDDVEAYRDWGIQTDTGLFTPKITLDLPDEEKEGLGPLGAASFNATATITVRAYVSAASVAAPGFNGGEVRVRQALTKLRRQIEVAIINDPAIMGAISSIKAVRSKMQGNQGANGAHLGELTMMFAFAYYQGPEDFAPLDAEELDLIHVDAAMRDPAGVDVTLDIPVT